MSQPASSPKDDGVVAATDEDLEAKNKLKLEEIHSWWEVPAIAHFCSLFKAVFGFCDFDIEDLEEALLTSPALGGSTLAVDIICQLLNGCYARDDIKYFNYDLFLKDIFKQRWTVERGLPNPFNERTFLELPVRKRAEVLHALCEFRLDADDVADMLKGLSGESLRVEPLGVDRKGCKYWYFYGTRLYKELPEKIEKGDESEKRPRGRPRKCLEVKEEEVEQNDGGDDDYEEQEESVEHVRRNPVLCAKPRQANKDELEENETESLGLDDDVKEEEEEMLEDESEDEAQRELAEALYEDEIEAGNDDDDDEDFDIKQKKKAKGKKRSTPKKAVATTETKESVEQPNTDEPKYIENMFKPKAKKKSGRGRTRKSRSRSQSAGRNGVQSATATEGEETPSAEQPKKQRAPKKKKEPVESTTPSRRSRRRGGGGDNEDEPTPVIFDTSKVSMKELKRLAIDGFQNQLSSLKSSRNTSRESSVGVESSTKLVIPAQTVDGSAANKVPGDFTTEGVKTEVLEEPAGVNRDRDLQAAVSKLVSDTLSKQRINDDSAPAPEEPTEQMSILNAVGLSKKGSSRRKSVPQRRQNKEFTGSSDQEDVNMADKTGGEEPSTDLDKGGDSTSVGQNADANDKSDNSSSAEAVIDGAKDVSKTLNAETDDVSPTENTKIENSASIQQKDALKGVVEEAKQVGDNKGVDNEDDIESEDEEEDGEQEIIDLNETEIKGDDCVAASTDWDTSVGEGEWRVPPGLSEVGVSKGSSSVEGVRTSGDGLDRVDQDIEMGSADPVSSEKISDKDQLVEAPLTKDNDSQLSSEKQSDKNQTVDAPCSDKTTDGAEKSTNADQNSELANTSNDVEKDMSATIPHKSDNVETSSPSIPKATSEEGEVKEKDEPVEIPITESQDGQTESSSENVTEEKITEASGKSTTAEEELMETEQALESAQETEKLSKTVDDVTEGDRATEEDVPMETEEVSLEAKQISTTHEEKSPFSMDVDSDLSEGALKGGNKGVLSHQSEPGQSLHSKDKIVDGAEQNIEGTVQLAHNKDQQKESVPTDKIDDKEPNNRPLANTEAGNNADASKQDSLKQGESVSVSPERVTDKTTSSPSDSVQPVVSKKKRSRWDMSPESRKQFDASRPATVSKEAVVTCPSPAAGSRKEGPAVVYLSSGVGVVSPVKKVGGKVEISATDAAKCKLDYGQETKLDGDLKVVEKGFEQSEEDVVGKGHKENVSVSSVLEKDACDLGISDQKEKSDNSDKIESGEGNTNDSQVGVIAVKEGPDSDHKSQLPPEHVTDGKAVEAETGKEVSKTSAPDLKQHLDGEESISESNKELAKSHLVDSVSDTSGHVQEMAEDKAVEKDTSILVVSSEKVTELEKFNGEQPVLEKDKTVEGEEDFKSSEEARQGEVETLKSCEETTQDDIDGCDEVDGVVRNDGAENVKSTDGETTTVEENKQKTSEGSGKVEDKSAGDDGTEVSSIGVNVGEAEVEAMDQVETTGVDRTSIKENVEGDEKEATGSEGVAESSSQVSDGMALTQDSCKTQEGKENDDGVLQTVTVSHVEVNKVSGEERMDDELSTQNHDKSQGEEDGAEKVLPSSSKITDLTVELKGQEDQDVSCASNLNNGSSSEAKGLGDKEETPCNNASNDFERAPDMGVDTPVQADGLDTAVNDTTVSKLSGHGDEREQSCDLVADDGADFVAVGSLVHFGNVKVAASSLIKNDAEEGQEEEDKRAEDLNEDDGSLVKKGEKDSASVAGLGNEGDKVVEEQTGETEAPATVNGDVDGGSCEQVDSASAAESTAENAESETSKDANDSTKDSSAEKPSADVKTEITENTVGLGEEEEKPECKDEGVTCAPEKEEEEETSEIKTETKTSSVPMKEVSLYEDGDKPWHEKLRRWQLVCDTLEDWGELVQRLEQEVQHLGEKTATGRNRTSRGHMLLNVIKNDFLPEMPAIMADKEQARERRQREMMPRRSSYRLEIKKMEEEEQDRLIREAEEEEERQRMVAEEEKRQLAKIEEEQRLQEEKEKARIDRANRVKLREERARLIAEGKEIPPELMNGLKQDDNALDDELEEMYNNIEKVLLTVKKNEHSWPFLEAVDEVNTPDYLEVIEEPMDLITIEKKIEERVYTKRKQFEKDMNLVFDNCIQYHGGDSDFGFMAENLKGVFERSMRRVFRVYVDTCAADFSPYRSHRSSRKRTSYREDSDSDGETGGHTKGRVMYASGRRWGEDDLYRPEQDTSEKEDAEEEQDKVEVRKPRATWSYRRDMGKEAADFESYIPCGSNRQSKTRDQQAREQYRPPDLRKYSGAKFRYSNYEKNKSSRLPLLVINQYVKKSKPAEDEGGQPTTETSQTAPAVTPAKPPVKVVKISRAEYEKLLAQNKLAVVDANNPAGKVLKLQPGLQLKAMTPPVTPGNAAGAAPSPSQSSTSSSPSLPPTPNSSSSRNQNKLSPASPLTSLSSSQLSESPIPPKLKNFSDNPKVKKSADIKDRLRLINEKLGHKLRRSTPQTNQEDGMVITREETVYVASKVVDGQTILNVPTSKGGSGAPDLEEHLQTIAHPRQGKSAPEKLFNVSELADIKLFKVDAVDSGSNSESGASRSNRKRESFDKGDSVSSSPMVKRVRFSDQLETSAESEDQTIGDRLKSSESTPASAVSASSLSGVSPKKSPPSSSSGSVYEKWKRRAERNNSSHWSQKSSALCGGNQQSRKRTHESTEKVSRGEDKGEGEDDTEVEEEDNDSEDEQPMMKYSKKGDMWQERKPSSQTREESSLFEKVVESESVKKPAEKKKEEVVSLSSQCTDNDNIATDTTPLHKENGEPSQNTEELYDDVGEHSAISTQNDKNSQPSTSSNSQQQHQSTSSNPINQPSTDTLSPSSSEVHPSPSKLSSSTSTSDTAAQKKSFKLSGLTSQLANVMAQKKQPPHSSSGVEGPSTSSAATTETSPSLEMEEEEGMPALSPPTLLPVEQEEPGLEGLGSRDQSPGDEDMPVLVPDHLPPSLVEPGQDNIFQRMMSPEKHKA